MEGVDLILIIAGFPCKGLSRQRGNNMPNLRDPQSALFEHIPRVEELLKKESAGMLKVYKIIENVVMETQPRAYISEKLGCIPVLVDAKYTCGASRPRLFWIDYPLTKLPGEEFHKKNGFNELIMVEDNERFNWWDEGFAPFDRQHQQNYPCIVGWETKTKEPGDARGFATASREALDP